ncbi:MAG: threonine synthase [Deltaproteobacteria bacterium]|nr:threonine synthase [Deltaproteobacteria bacterium]
MTLKQIKNLRCVICAKEYQPDEVDYVCPDHGTEGILDVQYDYDYIESNFTKTCLADSREMSIWRYKPLLPVEMDSKTPPIAVGWTPLYRADRLAAELGIAELWVKDDGRQPTASFKDRASAVAVVKAREKGADIVTTASTGNAAAALSGICAAIGQPNLIFVPDSAPKAKITQLLVYGSMVVLVKGTYGDAYDLCISASDKYGWYNRNTGYNPYMTEGKKTVAFEICEQLNWKVPDRVFVSVGDGSIIGGVHKGFKDLTALGWVDKMPKIVGVQAEGSSYLYQAWTNGEDVITKPAITVATIADSISAGLPRDRIKAMNAVLETDGAFVCVSDDEILQAITKMARGCGVFGEPAGAAAYAGLLKSLETNLVESNETMVVINTGNGLKDVNAALKATKITGPEPVCVEPKPAALEKVIQKLRL